MLAGSDLSEVFAMMRNDAGNVLDLAFDLMQAGSFKAAAGVLGTYEAGADHQPYLPMVRYTRAHALSHSGRALEASADCRQKARDTNPDYCFPFRLEEMLVLEDALERIRTIPVPTTIWEPALRQGQTGESDRLTGRTRAVWIRRFRSHGETSPSPCITFARILLVRLPAMNVLVRRIRRMRAFSSNRISSKNGPPRTLVSGWVF